MPSNAETELTLLVYHSAVRVFRPYDPIRQIEKIGDLWTLQKNRRSAVCCLTTHPLGWEVVVRIEGDLTISEVCRTDTAVLDISEAWQRQWQVKGWLPTNA